MLACSDPECVLAPRLQFCKFSLDPYNDLSRASVFALNDIALPRCEIIADNVDDHCQLSPLIALPEYCMLEMNSSYAWTRYKLVSTQIFLEDTRRLVRASQLVDDRETALA